ncbi:MAG: D-alanyl-D-alanine carboxypeptidase family protein [Ardenticatenaceae bacterium]|nr:D-alanyl-D-alanine carboxypeptidase family protein [Ardenticatenaceae bacterium]MCB8949863.1 D-alanyl-D-alanine carboxypeptidase family protein [Ardenticatenaceae bacterium]
MRPLNCSSYEIYKTRQVYKATSHFRNFAEQNIFSSSQRSKPVRSQRNLEEHHDEQKKMAGPGHSLHHFGRAAD